MAKSRRRKLRVIFKPIYTCFQAVVKFWMTARVNRKRAKNYLKKITRRLDEKSKPRNKGLLCKPWQKVTTARTHFYLSRWLKIYDTSTSFLASQMLPGRYQSRGELFYDLAKKKKFSSQVPLYDLNVANGIPE